MIKINRKHILLTAFFIAAIFSISSCSKPECNTSSDCISKTCSLSACENSKCSYKSIENCCGNKIKEAIEDGKPGSQCTCPQDYGKCEGKGKIKTSSRTEDAAFVSYYCNADRQCVLGVDKKDISIQNFPDSINVGFKASVVVKYNKPFDILRDSFEFKINLDDIPKDLVLPVRFTRIRLLYNSYNSRYEQLIAEKDLNNVLNGIGDKTTISMPLTLNYKPADVEETGSVRYSLDYSYTRQVTAGRTPGGANIYNNETRRETFSAPSKPVYFVRLE